MFSMKRPSRPDDPSCGAVVCAYNEESHLAFVLDGLLSSPAIDEIVVVDDGSIDGTAEIMRRYGRIERVRPVFISPNKGKGNAMAEGASLVRGDILLFVDADLLNWNKDYIELVLAPLASGKAEMSIGYPLRRDLFWDNVDPFGIQRWIAGERAIWRSDILPLLPSMRASRFGVETLINMHFKSRHWPVCLVALKDLVHPIKFEKTPGAEAWREYAKEALQILKTHARHPLYTFMTTVPDIIDLRDLAKTAVGLLDRRRRGASEETEGR
jgi:hypothetical protein